MWATIKALLDLGILVLREIFEAKKRSREERERFEAEVRTKTEMFESRFKLMRDQAALEHQQAIDIEDKVDQSMNGN